MRSSVLIGLALLVALASASPLAVEQKKTEDKPMNVVDIPAGVFENIEKEGEAAKSSESKAPEVEKVDEKETESVTTTSNTPNDKEKEQGPGIFGIRFPSIVIIRRPSIWQDPFAGFQSPFFGGFNRRPIFSRPPPYVEDGSAEVIREREPVSSSSQDSSVTAEQNRNETVLVNNVINRMHQQINNLFANLFNPNNFFMPRPSHPRPTFPRPSIFDLPTVGDSSELDDKIEFDKLPANYSNSTSETKVIDGQLVTVNKTVHKISGNNSNGFFHFSVIKVRPSNVPTDQEPIDAPKKEVEPVVIGSESESKPEEVKPSESDPKLNEVDRPEEEHAKLSEVELNNSMYNVNNPAAPPSETESPTKEEEIKIVPIKPAKLVRIPLEESGETKPSDLASDIRVNNVMRDSQDGRLRSLYDPDEVEIFNV